MNESFEFFNEKVTEYNVYKLDEISIIIIREKHVNVLFQDSI